jgi:hypothetical protein
MSNQDPSAGSSLGLDRAGHASEESRGQSSAGAGPHWQQQRCLQTTGGQGSMASLHDDIQHMKSLRQRGGGLMLHTQSL